MLTNSRYLYWLLPILILTAQTIYTFSSFNQIRIEEINDSIRNVYWMQYQELFTVKPKNVGWYAPLLVIYNIFGFNLFTAKIFKLFLELISLYALAAVLKNFLGIKKAWLPLFTLGISPTFIYYNLLQTPCGIDLLYFPIILYLLTTLNIKRRFGFFLKQILLWIIICIAIMSYPTFLFYIPSLIIFYIFTLFRQTKDKRMRIKSILISIVSIVTPWFLIFLYLKQKQLLLNGEGLISGTANLKFGVEIFFEHFYFLLDNLFNRSTGYYIEVKHVEFSHYLPILSLIFIFIITFKLLRSGKYRFPILLALLVLAINLFIGNMTSDIEVGLRRFTGVIAVIYFFFTLTWNYVLNLKRTQIAKLLGIVILLILPFHHVLVFYPNLDFLNSHRKFAEKYWFVQDETPVKSLDKYVEEIQEQDINVTCLDTNGKPTYCRYDLIFSSLEGYCVWNKLNCRKMHAIDPKTLELRQFSIHSGI